MNISNNFPYMLKEGIWYTSFMYFCTFDISFVEAVEIFNNKKCAELYQKPILQNLMLAGHGLLEPKLEQDPHYSHTCDTSQVIMETPGMSHEILLEYITFYQNFEIFLK